MPQQTTAPLVSAVIPAFNAAATIRRAVDSVLAQSYRNCEIIVVDDASRDATLEIVAAEYGDRVRLLRLPRNGGASHATNEGIAAARGELVAFLDADDTWLPDKLAHQVAALQGNPRAVIAASGCRFVDPQGRSRDAGIFALSVTPGEVWRLLLARTMIAKPCVMARADALRSVGPFDVELPVGEDQDMWIRLALFGEVMFVPEILTIVHDTAGSLTKVYADRSDQFLLPMIGRHVEQQRHRLSPQERRAILGERYATVGRNLYFSGSLVRGATLITRGMLHGDRVAANLWYLLAASPLIRTVKRLAGRGAERRGGNGLSRTPAA